MIVSGKGSLAWRGVTLAKAVKTFLRTGQVAAGEEVI
jgi:hypothetical protein